MMKTCLLSTHYLFLHGMLVPIDSLGLIMGQVLWNLLEQFHYCCAQYFLDEI
jgi:hypothetical protein